MSSPTTIGVNNDLTTSEACIASGPSDDEGTAGVGDISCVDKPFFGNGYLDNFFDEILSDLFVGDIGVVLT